MVPTPGGCERLLVVDDDPFIARLLEIELRAAGYDVRVASDGSLALSAAQERCPDLVLADVMMPNMDGFELTRRLRQDPRTALGLDHHADGARPLGRQAGRLRDRRRRLHRQALRYTRAAGSDPRRAPPIARHARAVAAHGPARQRPDRRGDRRPGDRGSGSRSCTPTSITSRPSTTTTGSCGATRSIQCSRRSSKRSRATTTGGAAFVGHVGGDDFVVVVAPRQAEAVAQAIVERFDREAPGLYDPDDRDRGYIEVTNRRGELQRFPVLTVSIGVASTDKRSLPALRRGGGRGDRDEAVHQGFHRLVLGDGSTRRLGTTGLAQRSRFGQVEALTEANAQGRERLELLAPFRCPRRP